MLDIDNEGIDKPNELNIDIQRKSMNHRKNKFGNYIKLYTLSINRYE